MLHRLRQLLVVLQLVLAHSPEHGATHDDCVLLQSTMGLSRVEALSLDGDGVSADSHSLLQSMLAEFGASPGGHPFWELDWSLVFRKEVLRCCIFLGLAGILCSAGGIGGGGIYVTVLMVAGSLTPHDAVPLSKAVVFFGSMSSLVLNVRKTMSSEGKQSLIDYNICRVVVPAALAGTLGGVYLNRHLGDVVLLSVLTCILLVMTTMTVNKTWSQWKEEEMQEQNEAAAPLAETKDTPQPAGLTEPAQADEESCKADAPTSTLYGSLDAPSKESQKKAGLGSHEVFFSVCTLFVVVGCGVLRFHAGACQAAIVGASDMLQHTCHHPTMRLLGDYLEQWMTNALTGERVLFDALALPFAICFSVCFYYSYLCVTQAGWTVAEVTKYSVMASTTGCLAGLVGIGGGLIFSPFFLISGVDPAVAVATSSTCVIFTSSSTTLQYLLTDRIITSLTIVYGLVNLLASYIGTSLVHMLQDRLSARKSYITSIVAVGVIISTVLAADKLWDLEHAVHPVQMH